jgi:CheY-like chemotaxis protein
MERSGESTDDAAPFDFSGRFAVLIDDDVDVLAGLSATLQKWGCRCLTANSGADALSKLGTVERVPDFIIADHQLGEGETGVHIIDAIRHEFNAHLPALLLTADTSPDTARKAVQHQLPILYKPVTAQALRSVIGALLDPVEQRETAAEHTEAQHVSAGPD